MNTGAEIIGKLLMEGKMFGEEPGVIVSSKIERSFLPVLFLSWRLLKAIDSRCQGSLNESAVCDYVNLEKTIGLLFTKKAKLSPQLKSHLRMQETHE